MNMQKSLEDRSDRKGRMLIPLMASSASGLSYQVTVEYLSMESDRDVYEYSPRMQQSNSWFVPIGSYEVYTEGEQIFDHLGNEMAFERVTPNPSFVDIYENETSVYTITYNLIDTNERLTTSYGSISIDYFVNDEATSEEKTKELDINIDGDDDTESVVIDPNLPNGEVDMGGSDEDGDGDLDKVKVGGHGGGFLGEPIDIDGDGKDEIIALDPLLNPESLKTPDDCTKDLDNDGNIDFVNIGIGLPGLPDLIPQPGMDVDGDNEKEVILLDPNMMDGETVDYDVDGDGDVDVRIIGVKQA